MKHLKHSDSKKWCIVVLRQVVPSLDLHFIWCTLLFCVAMSSSTNIEYLNKCLKRNFNNLTMECEYLYILSQKSMFLFVIFTFNIILCMLWMKIKKKTKFHTDIFVSDLFRAEKTYSQTLKRHFWFRQGQPIQCVDDTILIACLLIIDKEKFWSTYNKHFVLKW